MAEDAAPPRPSLAQLRALVAVAAEGSFSAAAARLGVTQSNVSHAVSALERGVGRPLVRRGRRGATLTDAGARVAARARQVLELVDDLPRAAEGEADVRGTVRVACFRSVATHVLPAALARLASLHPGLRLEVDDACRERDAVERAVRGGDAHVGLALLPVGADLIARPFGGDAFVLVLPRDRSLPPRPAWNDLADLPYLQPACEEARRAYRACVRDGLSARPALEVGEDSSILSLVAQGAGFSILPRLAAEPAPGGALLRPLPLPLRRTFGVVTRPAAANDPAVRAVVDAFADRGLLAGVGAVRAGLWSLAGDGFAAGAE